MLISREYALKLIAQDVARTAGYIYIKDMNGKLVQYHILNRTDMKRVDHFSY